MLTQEQSKQTTSSTARLVLAFAFGAVVALLAYSAMIDEMPTVKEAIIQANANVDLSLRQELEAHKKTIAQITEVRASVQKQVAAMDSDDVAVALNDALRIWRSNDGTSGLAESLGGVLDERAGRAGLVISGDRIQAEK
jgi:hypothetical protein